MNEAATARAVIRASVYGPAWHGPSVTDALKEVNAARAAAHPIPSAHSIWELLLHMNAWQQFVLDTAEGVDPPMLEGDENFPLVTDASEAAWEAAKRAFFSTADHLIERCASVSEDELARPVTQHQFSFKVMLHGIAHHNIYHAGQIALLKK